MKPGVIRTHLPEPSAPIPRHGELRLRPRYNECDPMGVVYHGSYIPWLEMGRTELLRLGGVTYAHMEAGGVFLVIIRLECRYRRPGRYDDDLVLRTRVTGGSRVKIEHAYEVLRLSPDGGEELLVTAESTLACVGGDGRPMELPLWLQFAP